MIKCELSQVGAGKNRQMLARGISEGPLKATVRPKPKKESSNRAEVKQRSLPPLRQLNDNSYLQPVRGTPNKRSSTLYHGHLEKQMSMQPSYASPIDGLNYLNKDHAKVDKTAMLDDIIN